MPKTCKTTIFNDDWINPSLNSEWCSWLKAGARENEAKCILCAKTIQLSNMGKQAIVSHSEGNKHKEKIRNRRGNIQLLQYQKRITTVTEQATFSDNNNNCNAVATLPVSQITSEAVLPLDPPTPSTSSVSGRQPNMSFFLQKDVVARAEIIACLATVKLHLSNRSNEEYIKLLPIMFEDSNTARSMKLHRQKIAYSISYGLAPFFEEQLKNSVIGSNKLYVISFDESFNKISQSEQQDLYITFFDDNKNEVSTRYLSSSFLGHTTAADLLRGLKNCLKEFDLTNLLQLSMDGPNVNFKLLNDLKAELKYPDGPRILELGSCGLHTVHNSFKTAMNASQWNVVKFLRAIYNLFKYVPARRADYIRHTGSSDFALKFCSIRWLENATVAERALKMLPQLKKFIERVKESKNEPKCNSYEIVKQCVGDELLSSKLAFFKTLAEDLQGYLLQFQADKPMAPLMYEALHDVMRTVLDRFIKKEVMEKNKTVSDLIKIKVDDRANHKPLKNISLGFATKMELRKVENQVEILKFKNDCIKSLSEFSKKMFTKCPLSYKIVKGISCLDPIVIMEQSVASRRLNLVLESLVDARRLCTLEADKISKYFHKFISEKDVIKEVELCNKTLKKDGGAGNKHACRLDKLYLYLCETQNAPDVFVKFIKLVLTLSHGNASVERGFSINSRCLIENLLESSLIGQRLVYDAVMHAGGIENVEINKKMIHYFRNAHSKYTEDLKKRQLLKGVEDEEKHRKRINSIKLRELEEKKRRLDEENRKMEAQINEEINSLKTKL